MATIIEALVVTLGLDPKALKKGSQDAEVSLGRVDKAATGVQTSIVQAGKTGAESLRSLSREALTFFAVLTAGKSLKAFVQDNTSANVALGNLSRNLGVSTQSLGAWQNVARSFGGTADDVSGSMQSLVSQFQTIDGQRNLSVLFSQIGVSLTGANGQLRNMNDLLPDLARASQKFGPQMFSAWGAKAGFSQGFVNMLEQGPDKIEALYKALQQYAPTPADVSASAQLMQDWVKLTAQSEAFGRTIMTSLTPELHDLMNTVSGLVDKYGDVIRLDIIKYAGDFGKAVKAVDWRQVGTDIGRFVDYLRSIDWDKIGEDIKEIGSGADSAAKAFGGWTRAAEIFLGVWAVSKVAPVIGAMRTLAGLAEAPAILAAAAGYGAHKALTYADKNDDIGTGIDRYVPFASVLDNFMATHFGVGRTYDQQYARVDTAKTDPKDMQSVLSSLGAAGWTKEQASGIAANLVSESHLNPQVSGDNGSAYGIGQWHADRQANYARLFGHSMQSVTDRAQALREQVKFVDWELRNSESDAGNRIRGAKSAAGAGALASFYYERPGDAGGQANRRAILADYINNQTSSIGAAQSQSPSGGDTTNNHAVTNNFHISVPSGSVQAVKQGVIEAMRDPRFIARQSNLGIQ